MAVLEACAAAPEGATAREVAARLDLTIPTSSHLLGTLVYVGYLQKQGSRHLLSWRIAELYEQLVARARPEEKTLTVMKAIAASTGETVYISCWIDGDVVVTAVAEGNQPVRASGIHVGTRGAAHARASGKLLLALGPEARVTQFLMSHSLDQFTPATITDPETLLDELAATRSRGFAVDREERFPEVCCVAIPISLTEPPGSVAISVMLPRTRFDSFLKSKLPDILDYAPEVM